MSAAGKRSRTSFLATPQQHCEFYFANESLLNQHKILNLQLKHKLPSAYFKWSFPLKFWTKTKKDQCLMMSRQS